MLKCIHKLICEKKEAGDMKETQKQIIERLEGELKEYKTLCSNLNKEVLEMQERADKSFLNSSDYVQMKKQIELLEAKNKMLETKATKVEKVHKLINEGHNTRGAGRKTRLTDQEKEMIRMYRIQGKTIKELAEMYACSVGLIHKIVNE